LHKDKGFGLAYDCLQCTHSLARCPASSSPCAPFVLVVLSPFPLQQKLSSLSKMQSSRYYTEGQKIARTLTAAFLVPQHHTRCSGVLLRTRLGLYNLLTPFLSSPFPRTIPLGDGPWGRADLHLPPRTPMPPRTLTRSNRDLHTFLSTHTMREKQRAKRQDRALTSSLECFLPLSTTSSSSSIAFLTTTPFGSTYKEDEEPDPFPPAPRLVRQDAYLGLEDTDDEEDEDDEDEMEGKKEAPRGLFVHTNQFGMDDATAAATAAVLAAVRNLTCNTWNDALLLSPLASPSFCSMSASTSSSSSFFPTSRPPTTTTAAATTTCPGSVIPSCPSSSAVSSSSCSSSSSSSSSSFSSSSPSPHPPLPPTTSPLLQCLHPPSPLPRPTRLGHFNC